MINLKIFKTSPDAITPTQATPGSAAYDLYSTIDFSLFHHEHIDFSLGFKSSFNDNYVALIVPRSGLGSKGFTFRNTIGVIDSDYRGEWGIRAWNKGRDKLDIKKGDRIAQVIFVARHRANFIEVASESDLDDSQRAGGFGSSGL